MSLLCLVFIVIPPIMLYFVFQIEEKHLDKYTEAMFAQIFEDNEPNLFLEPDTKAFEDFVNDLDMDGL